MHALAPMRAAGAKPAHVERLLRRWLAGESVELERAVANHPLPLRARELLPELDRELASIARVASEHPSSDGCERLLVRLADGLSVECVLLPRQALCVSTQVGCAVGCTFCTTGLGGLERQLTSAEILAQVALARRRRAVHRVVFMGMGEPSHNLAAVLEAITLLGTAGNFGHKQLVFSTVGEPRAFERLRANAVRPALALSLHSTDAERRARLLPRAPRVDPRELVESALDYALATGHPLQVQWTLLAGENDGDDELERLIEWLRGRRAIVNFIPYNTTAGAPHSRTPFARAREMVQRMHQGGVLAKLRQTVADEVEGACGQLRARRG